MHVVSTNFAKTLLANLNMTSQYDVTNGVYPVTMTTIRHCSILEFGRGASNQAVEPVIARPLHVTASLNTFRSLAREWHLKHRFQMIVIFQSFFQNLLLSIHRQKNSK